MDKLQVNSKFFAGMSSSSHWGWDASFWFWVSWKPIQHDLHPPKSPGFRTWQFNCLSWGVLWWWRTVLRIVLEVVGKLGEISCLESEVNFHPQKPETTGSVDESRKNISKIVWWEVFYTEMSLVLRQTEFNSGKLFTAYVCLCCFTNEMLPWTSVNNWTCSISHSSMDMVNPWTLRCSILTNGEYETRLSPGTLSNAAEIIKHQVDINACNLQIHITL